jgi:hypothetical protein
MIIIYLIIWGLAGFLFYKTKQSKLSRILRYFLYCNIWLAAYESSLILGAFNTEAVLHNMTGSPILGLRNPRVSSQLVAWFGFIALSAIVAFFALLINKMIHFYKDPRDNKLLAENQKLREELNAAKKGSTPDNDDSTPAHIAIYQDDDRGRW